MLFFPINPKSKQNIELWYKIQSTYPNIFGKNPFDEKLLAQLTFNDTILLERTRDFLQKKALDNKDIQDYLTLLLEYLNSTSGNKHEIIILRKYQQWGGQFVFGGKKNLSNIFMYIPDKNTYSITQRYFIINTLFHEFRHYLQNLMMNDNSLEIAKRKAINSLYEVISDEIISIMILEKSKLFIERDASLFAVECTKRLEEASFGRIHYSKDSLNRVMYRKRTTTSETILLSSLKNHRFSDHPNFQ